MQMMLLGAGGDAKKTYIEDIFSTNVWTGNDSIRTISPGFDLSSSGDGGLVWIKSRTRSDEHILGGSWLGDNKYLKTNTNQGPETNQTARLKTVTSSGFQIGTSDAINQSPHTYASWCFKNTDNFFKIVEWTGNGTNPRNIAHGLGSKPGMIIAKRTDGAGDWYVYHRNTGSGNATRPNGSQWELNLNKSDGRFYDGDSANPNATQYYWNNTEPDGTNFTVSEKLNENNFTYLAYVFAGGESDAAAARSVDFDGSNDSLNLAASNDFIFTGDLTIECWVKPHSYPHGSNQFWCLGDYTASNGVVCYMSDELYLNQDGNDRFAANGLPLGHWSHVAVVRSGSTVTMYVNGTSVGSYTNSTNWGSTSNRTFRIGAGNNGGSHDWEWDGEISNLRVVNGTAVYTSSFKPPTEPLTSITNTVLLCCNNSSTTGKTTGGTITAISSPSASIHSPFDDPAAFKFGDAGDQNVIKCGSYVGNSSSLPEINIGFEPSWILIKNLNSGGTYRNWFMFDNMRGVASNDHDANFRANSSDTESTQTNYIDFTSTGFKIGNGDDGSTAGHGGVNENGQPMIYMAIRRPDGYVGKPPAAASDVFKVVAGGNNTQPTYNSGFQTDFSIRKSINSGSVWVGTSRLTGRKYLRMNDNDAEANIGSNQDWSFENGMGSWTSNESTMTSWNWKRHKGFDVVPYNVRSSPPGNREQIPHSLNAVPEMIWVKARTGGGGNDQWAVYHKDLSGTGGHAYNAYLWLTTDAAAGSSTSYWVQAPTSTHFTVSTNNGRTGDSQHNYIAYLFASSNDADGNAISKVGTYTGNTSSQPNVYVGFQPSFILIKRASGSDDWNMYDTLRGISQSGDEKRAKLNKTDAQDDQNHISLHSDGFTIQSNNDAVGGNGDQYVYYCHK